MKARMFWAKWETPLKTNSSIRGPWSRVPDLVERSIEKSCSKSLVRL